ncbi:unnamed protein product [Rotaria sp. Silwood1]|nr:unnamed protein product [Rotaria sp. Silwood1]CAF3413507.1 unnamed protein product [Rotaria sp. Silwood1]CAF4577384.1 unnamed protein product [Rotaria sp. Silwood1]CAF4646525.1 unnamed protein product [Rotaria sp. Silwood1]
MISSRNTFLLILICILSSITSSISENVVDDVVDTNKLNNSTTTGQTTENPVPRWAGFVGCLVASIFFGSNLLPVKQFSAGDGFFFQFIFCVAVWVVGLVLDLILGNQRFYPLVLLGGVLWTTGNLVTVFCIKTCGLAVGLLIWGTTSLITGWAGGRFGIFGIQPQVPQGSAKLAMNYASVILAALSGIFFLFIKSTTAPRAVKSSNVDDDRSSIELEKAESTNAEESVDLETDFPFLNRLSDRVQQIVGCVLASAAGIFYGVMFIPDQYIRDHAENYKHNDELPPNNGLYYINSQYSGVLLSSLFYFIIYAAFKRNKPSIYPSIALPAMVSGTMWGIANIGFIVAISALKNAVAYPIVNVLPGIVTSLWSLFLFREIQGRKNYIFLGIGMLIRILAAILSGLSA